MTVLVIAEHDNASLKGATLNTVTAAVACGAGDVHVLIAGHNAGAAAAAAAQIAGVAKVLHADSDTLAHALAENLAAQVLAAQAANGYSHILFAATAIGKNAAPRVAAKLDVAQISEITKIVSADTFERPIYAGNAIATVQSADAVKVITVRTTGFDAAAATGGSAARLQMEGRHLAKRKAQRLFAGHVVGPALQLAADGQRHLDRAAHAQRVGLGGEQPRQLHELAGFVLRAGQGGHGLAVAQHHLLGAETQLPAPRAAEQHLLLAVEPARRQALRGEFALAGDVARQHRADGGGQVHLVARALTQPFHQGRAFHRATVVAQQLVAEPGGRRPGERLCRCRRGIGRGRHGHGRRGGGRWQRWHWIGDGGGAWGRRRWRWCIRACRHRPGAAPGRATPPTADEIGSAP